MKGRIIRFFSVAAISAALASAQGQQGAQQPGKVPGNKVSQPEIKRAGSAFEPQDNSGVIPVLLFNGGSVRELVATLKEVSKDAGLPPLNVIVAKDIPEESNIPKFELHNVRYRDVFLALNKMNAGSGAPQWQFSAESGGEQIWVLNVPPSQGFPIQNIDPLTGQPIPPGGPPKTCQIYQLQRYLEKYKVEDITTAIQTAWAMVGIEKGTELKYHKDTSLLIVVGKPDQLEVIGRVLHSLDEGLASKVAVSKPAAEVYVHGAVSKPGAVALDPEKELDVMGAIMRAGGLSRSANESKIKLIRRDSAEKTEQTLSLADLKNPNKERIFLKPGDIIDVAEKLF